MNLSIEAVQKIIQGNFLLEKPQATVKLDKELTRAMLSELSEADRADILNDYCRCGAPKTAGRCRCYLND
jgi:hypothetical protein